MKRLTQIAIHPVGVVAVCCVVIACARQEMPPMSEMRGGCDAYRWDMSRELALAVAPGEEVRVYNAAAANAEAAPLNKRLNVELFPTSSVRFVVEPEKRGKRADEFAGLLRFVVPEDGNYRVSTGSAVWVEIASADGKRVRAPTFEMQSSCDKVFKSAAFPLRANVAYWLQMSASKTQETHILLTRAP
jgi:hypothetical protein